MFLEHLASYNGAMEHKYNMVCEYSLREPFLTHNVIEKRFLCQKK